jgi:AhpC/TSA family
MVWMGGSTVVWCMPIYIVLLALLQSPVPQPMISLTEDCSGSARVLAHLAADASFKVRFSVAGNERACYAVTAVLDGQPVNGYVQGDDLPILADFERQRATVAASLVTAPPPTGPVVAATAPAAAQEKPHYPPFRDFWAADMNGKPVGARSLKGKVNLVCFWSPGSPAASRELLLVAGLYGKFKKQGVDAVSVSLGNLAEIKDTLDDFRPGFRNVPGGYSIAANYNIDFGSLPRTYVLNENFEVIASGLHKDALESLVKKLIAEK